MCVKNVKNLKLSTKIMIETSIGASDHDVTVTVETPHPLSPDTGSHHHDEDNVPKNDHDDSLPVSPRNLANSGTNDTLTQKSEHISRIPEMKSP